MLLVAALALSGPLLAQPVGTAGEGAATEEPGEPQKGIPIADETIVARCSRCHARDDEGQLSRISFLRKTPEGWQTSIRRMVMLQGVRLDPAEARDMVRYLSDHHGLAPEEARPGLFDAERRMIDHTYTADETTFNVCKACHSMGRVITQRRTAEEWGLLVAMHRGYYPIVDVQGLRSFEPPEDGQHPMDKAIAHLSQAFPLETPEWSEWQATMRPPRLDGRWAISGHQAGEGPIYGEMTIRAGDRPGEVTTSLTWTDARSGRTTERTGRAIVYTGFQWRGRSFLAGRDGDDEASLREVLFVERDWRKMSGRWFTGAYDEIGIDVTLRRIGGDSMVTGVVPTALATDAGTTELQVWGAGFPEALTAADVDLGPGLRVESVRRDGGDRLTVRVRVAEDATVGSRDVFVAGALRPRALAVYDSVSRIEIRPEAGMARVGGANFPKQLQQFEAYGWNDGPDGEPGTDDDLELGLVDVEWGLEEYAVTYGDDDLAFSGSLDDNGLFTPALDGPNPERSGRRNNVGDLWVLATYDGGGKSRPLEARAHLLVTVPLYMRWEPWRVGE